MWLCFGSTDWSSCLFRWPASTPGTPRSISCMWALRRWRTASGGQSGNSRTSASTVIPCFIYYFTASYPKLNLLTFGCIGKKTYVPQRKTRWVPPQLLLLVIISLRCRAQRKTFMLQVETYKSFRPGDIVLAKVVSFTCCRIEAFEMISLPMRISSISSYFV